MKQSGGNGSGLLRRKTFILSGVEGLAMTAERRDCVGRFDLAMTGKFGI